MVWHIYIVLGGLEFLVGKKKSKSLCFWCILKMPSIKIFWLSHRTLTHTNTRTHTYPPHPHPPPQKKTSYYISEFFFVCNFSIHANRTNLRKPVGWKPGFFKFHETIEEWSLAQKLLETFPHLEAWAALAGCFFLGNFPVDFFVESCSRLSCSYACYILVVVVS